MGLCDQLETGTGSGHASSHSVCISRTQDHSECVYFYEGITFSV